MSPDDVSPDAPEDEPAIEADAAAIQEPAVEEPVVEEPAVEEPVVEAPAVEEPVAEEPVAEAPADAAADAPAEAPKPAASTREAKVPAGDAEAPKVSRAPKRARPARRAVVRAQAKYVRTSARKARMVCGHIRGKSVDEARAILAFTPRDVARDWSKLLESAVANAENNHELVGDDLIVHEAYADEGPTIKRFRPRAMGRATPIRKRTSHLTITLTPRS